MSNSTEVLLRFTRPYQRSRQRLRNRPVAAMIVFTDGNSTDQPDISGSDTESMPPVFPVIQDVGEFDVDLRVREVRVSQTIFETSPTTVEATVDAMEAKGQQIVGELVDMKGNVIEQLTQNAQPDRPTAFRFRFRPEKPGLNFYVFRVRMLSDQSDFETGTSVKEITLQNNIRHLVVDRKSGPYRILYVAGRPNWEFKFLRRALEEDAEMKLSGLLRIARKEPRFSFQDRSGLGDQEFSLSGIRKQRRRRYRIV